MMDSYSKEIFVNISPQGEKCCDRRTVFMYVRHVRPSQLTCDTQTSNLHRNIFVDGLAPVAVM